MKLKVLGHCLTVRILADGSLGKIVGWSVDKEGTIVYIVASTNFDVETTRSGPSKALPKDDFEVLPDQGDPIEELVELPSSLFETEVADKINPISGIAVRLAYYSMERFYIVVKTKVDTFHRIPIHNCAGEAVDALSPEQRTVHHLPWEK